MTAEPAINALHNELRVLQSKHDTLGEAYRHACEELMGLRKENADYRARLHAVRVLCETFIP